MEKMKNLRAEMFNRKASNPKSKPEQILRIEQQINVILSEAKNLSFNSEMLHCIQHDKNALSSV